MSLVASATCKKSHKSVVLKAYIKSRLSKSLMEMVYREIRLHGEVTFLDGVAEILGWFEDDLQIVLVLEHCTGGDVYRRLVLEGGQMSESSAATDVLNPLVKAMVGVHRKRLSHRDLKPENLFYCCSPEGDRKLKIGDFGLASDLQEMRDRVGTLDYMAPEILLQQDETAFSTQAIGDQAEDADSGSMQPKVADGPYTSKVDVWAVGIIAYELLTGRPPFEVNSPHQTAMLIVWGSPEFPDYVSASAREFILMALQKDPDERPSMEELLRQPFLSSYTDAPFFSSKRSQFLKGRASFKVTKQDLVNQDDDEDIITDDASAFQKRRLDNTQTQQSKTRVRRGVTMRDISLASNGTGDAHLKAKVKPLKAQHKPRGQNSFRAAPANPHSSHGVTSNTVKPATKWSRGPSRMSDDSCYTDLDSAGKISKPSTAPPKKVRMSDHSAASDMSSTGHSIHLSSGVPGRLSVQSAPSPPRSILKTPSDSDAAPGADAASYRVSVDSNLRGAKTRAFSSRAAVSLTGTETGVDSWDRKSSLFNRFFSSLLCGRASMDGEMCGTGDKPIERSSDGSQRGCKVGQGGLGASEGRRQSRSRRISAASGGRLSMARTSDASSVTFSIDELQQGHPSQTSENDDASRTPAVAGSSNRRRELKKSASRIGMGLSRLLSRIGLDDGDSSSAPWNTNGAHLVRMTQQLRNAPDMDTLEAMKANAKSSTRNRMKEYMVRRGGDNETTRQSLAHENMPSALVAGEAKKTPEANGNGNNSIAAQESFPDTAAEVESRAPFHRLRQSRRSRE